MVCGWFLCLDFVTYGSAAGYGWNLTTDNRIVARTQSGLKKWELCGIGDVGKVRSKKKRLSSFDAFINKVRQTVSLGQCLPL